jgi:hypothetical protein
VKVCKMLTWGSNVLLGVSALKRFEKKELGGVF